MELIQRKYEEKLIEDYIRDFPKIFLGEPLTFLHQQAVLAGFRPDLIFLDSNKIPVIVEIQLKALDRTHLYKSLEYRDLYYAKEKCEKIRVILVCNSLPKKYFKVLSTHNVECVKFSKEDFLQKLKNIAPHVKILPIKKTLEESALLTPISLLKIISNDLIDDNEIFPDGVFAYWAAGTGHYNVNLSCKLNKIIYKNNGLISPDNISDSATFKSEIGYQNVIVPLEYFFRWDGIEKVDFSHFHTIIDLLSILAKVRSGKDDIEINLGGFGGTTPLDDPFHWKEYMKGVKTELRTIESRYSLEVGYDAKKIKEDLELFRKLEVYTGKYPNYQICKLFDRYEVVQGPASRRERFNEWKNSLKGLGENFSEQLDKSAVEAEKEWITIKLYSCPLQAIRTIEFILKHLLYFHFPKDQLRLSKQCNHCLNPPIQAKMISRNSLNLSSKYFLHLKPFQE